MLPDKKTKPTFEFCKEKILLYGQWKTGKTALVSALPFETLILAAEEGYNKVEAFVSTIKSWKQFKETIDEVIAGQRFQIIAVDTVEALWRMWVTEFLAEKNIKHEQELGWGVGYTMLVREFLTVIDSLTRTGRGLILISHENIITYEAELKTMRRAEPNLNFDKHKQILTTICAFCDYIFYMHIGGYMDKEGKPQKGRIISTAPAEDYVAGYRFPILDPIPLIEGDPAKSAQRLVNAYNLSAKGTEK